MLENKWWARYHGVSGLYAFLTVACTGLLLPSEVADENDGDRNKLYAEQFETVEGRGVYTSSDWEKAMHFAVPHILPDSNLFTQIVLLVAVPGESAVGGPSLWYHQSKASWVKNDEGVWVKFHSWYLTKESIQGESTDEQLGAMLRDQLKFKCSRKYERLISCIFFSW